MQACPDSLAWESYIPVSMTTQSDKRRRTAMSNPGEPLPTGTRPRREGTFGRDDWLTAARKSLVKGGIDQVKIERLAKHLHLTRGSFYYHFRSRVELLHALLDHWEATNTGPMLRAIDAAIATGPRGIHALVSMWIEEREFSPAYDSAVRDWARKDATVAQVVRAVDEKRINALTRLIEMYGYRGDEAVVRARIMYFHQVGYYALAMHESMQERRRLEPVYMKALIGFDI